MTYIDLETFLVMLKKIIHIQTVLVKNYLGLVKTQGVWPKSGQINIFGELWEFRRHGAGVCFTNLQTKEEIDAHTSMEQFPHGFDEWRLDTYFLSVGNIIVTVNQQMFDLHSIQGIKHLIEYLLHSQTIVPISGTQMYELI
jgi:hypothetical protein